MTRTNPDQPMQPLIVDPELADTPEVRQWAEENAIPRCWEWRRDNPELDKPAPYCCSAYCSRCAVLRKLDGIEPLLPNEWISRA